MTSADLEGADLFYALLYDAYLSRADLEGADLKSAILDDDTDLKKADLKGVKGITNEQLHQSGAILDGATMPNGQK